MNILNGAPQDVDEKVRLKTQRTEEGYNGTWMERMSRPRKMELSGRKLYASRQCLADGPQAVRHPRCPRRGGVPRFVCLAFNRSMQPMNLRLTSPSLCRECHTPRSVRFPDYDLQ